MASDRTTVLLFLLSVSLFTSAMDNDITHITKKIKVGNDFSFKPYKTLATPDKRTISAIALNTNSQKIACGFEEETESDNNGKSALPGYIIIYDVETEKECNRIKPQGDGDISALKFTRHGQNEALFVVTTSYNNRDSRGITFLEEWDVTTPHYQFKNGQLLGESFVIEALFNPDGSILAVLQQGLHDHNEQYCTFYDTFYAKETNTVYLKGDYSFAYYVNNKDLVFKNKSNKVLEAITSLYSKKVEGEITGEICYSPNTNTIAHGDKGRITINTNNRIQTIETKRIHFNKIIFNNTGTIIAYIDLLNKIYLLKKR